MSHILLAEDDSAMREFLTLALKKAGFEVTSCEDGMAAYEALQSPETDDFDLLLADIVMPGMDGIELARKANKIYPDLKVMYITGFTAVAAKNNSELHPHARVLSKPFHLNDLVNQVKDTLKEG